MSYKLIFRVTGVKSEDTKLYDAKFYQVKAHCRSCFFCDHCTDIFWDFSNGPYMFLCDKNMFDMEAIKKGIIGKCKSFEEGGTK